ncbi:ABC transporter ATP-binding protein [Herbiconiux daphne]|uniref:ABC transporter ATP-binding protein/permease n=1 Tax=Herbiconiux daphne TaxID=2970914 RepID=A0ABT2H1C7_9MICO|nr:ABC transporter ATP-binding protein [Herbiconiux daphne]MCS5733729.1 ABC transporter ATP-binding protein/permease [Herbiconiux daphne]
MSTSTAGADRLPIADGRTVLREAQRAIGRRWRQLALLVVVLVAAATAGLVSPLALGSIVDAVGSGLRSGDASFVWRLGAVMAGAIVVGAVLTAAGVVAASVLFERMLAVLRERMVEAAFALPQSRVERAGTGDLISRAGDDVAEVSRAIPSVVPAVAGSLFTIAVTVVGMAVIDVWYAVALLVVVPVHIVSLRWYLRQAPGVYAAERAAMADRAQHLLDSLRGLESVRAFGLGPHHVSRIAAVSWSVVRWTMRARGIQNALYARLNLGELLGMAGVLVVGFVLVAQGAGSIGGTTAAMLLFLRLFGPINQLLFVVDELQSALASLGRIVGVITAAPSGGLAAAPPGSPSPAQVGLHLEAVSHSYVDGHPVLTGIDLAVRPGETVAIVGASGAGKSTLAAIAAGVHEPASGAVRRSGAVVLVTQEVHVFDSTLRENLTLTRPGATDAELLTALHRVGAERLVSRLTRGLSEPIGASGATLTPAEAQQLALARVLLADPPIVILDEATAEAGSADAGRLEHAAAVVGSGRTVLVIAHRLSQAAAADRVILMERGRIEEQGTHADLLAAGHRYARLWAAWSRA